jgi:hypothetical protein
MMRDRSIDLSWMLWAGLSISGLSAALMALPAVAQVIPNNTTLGAEASVVVDIDPTPNSSKVVLPEALISSNESRELSPI